MKCPHCLVAFHASFASVGAELPDQDGYFNLHQTYCPECKRVVIVLTRDVDNFGQKLRLSSVLVRPRTTSRPVPPEVPEQFANDYKEAALVMADSPKASVALSRRCLQAVLRDKRFKARSIDAEIDKAIKSKTLPSYLTDSLHAVRVIGNFAAHPMKSKSSGEIINVEPGEAEQQLDTLDLLFDFYYVQPALADQKRAALNSKLADAGKSPLK